MFYAIFNMNDFSRASGKYRYKSSAQADCDRMNLKGRIYQVVEVDATGHPF
jgi:hypothetical protein